MDIGGLQNYEYKNLMNYLINYHCSHLEFRPTNYFFHQGHASSKQSLYIASGNLTTYKNLHGVHYLINLMGDLPEYYGGHLEFSNSLLLVP